MDDENTVIQNIQSGSITRKVWGFSTIFADDFESDDSFDNWYEQPTGGNFKITEKTCNSSSHSMELYGGGISVWTHNIDTSDVIKLKIGYWVRRGGPPFSDPPEFGIDLFVEYYSSTGVWKNIETFPGYGSPGEITNSIQYLPINAYHPEFKLKFRRASGGGGSSDYWHIDDVFIQDKKPPTLEISASDEAPTKAIQTQNNICMATFTLTARNDDISLLHINISLTGTGDGGDISEVSIVKDMDGSGNYTSGDEVISKGQMSKGKITFDNPMNVPKDSIKSVLILYSIDEFAAVGHTVGAYVSIEDIKTEMNVILVGFTEVQSTNTLIEEKGDPLKVEIWDVSPGSLEQGCTDIPIISILLSSPRLSITLSELEFTLIEGFNPKDIVTINLYQDYDSNNILDPNRDALLFSKSMYTAKVVFDNIELDIDNRQHERLFVSISIKIDAELDSEFGLTFGPEHVRVLSPDDVEMFDDFTNVGSNVVDTTAPDRPNGLTAESISFDSVGLQWDENEEEDLAGYNIYRREGTYSDIWGKPINGETPISDTEYQDEDIDELTDYYYVVTALDEVPNESEYSEHIETTIPLGPKPPVVEGAPDRIQILEDQLNGETIMLGDWFHDANGDPLNFTVQGGNNIWVTLDSSSGLLILEPKPDWSGEEILTIIATDGTHNTRHNLTVAVFPVNDRPGTPVILQPDRDLDISTGTLLTFYGECDDRDIPYGDTLSYSWSSDITGLLGNGETLNNALLPIGSHVITLTVTDSFGLKSFSRINITVIGSADGKDPRDNKDNNQTDDQNAAKSEKATLSTSFIITLLSIITIITFVVLFLHAKYNKKNTNESEDAPKEPIGELLVAEIEDNGLRKTTGRYYPPKQ